MGTDAFINNLSGNENEIPAESKSTKILTYTDRYRLSAGL